MRSSPEYPDAVSLEAWPLAPVQRLWQVPIVFGSRILRSLRGSPHLRVVLTTAERDEVTSVESIMTKAPGGLTGGRRGAKLK